MEGRLDAVENGDMPAHGVWNAFVEHFKNLHTIALELKSRTPTPRQKALFDRLWVETEDKRKLEILSAIEQEVFM